MSKIDDGGPAFPFPYSGLSSGPTTGMSRRDWFAGQALAGLQAGDSDINPNPEQSAKRAYRFADAMIAAGKEEQKGQ